MSDLQIDTDKMIDRPPRNRLSWLRQKLVVRIAFLVSLAVLPIGLVAVGQTWRALGVSTENLEASIHARTANLISAERQDLLTKIGTARTLADTLSADEFSAETCSAIMRRVQTNNSRLAFAGLLAPNSVSECNSLGQHITFPRDTRSDDLFANPEPYITFSQQGSVSGRPVIVVAYPSYSVDEVFQGFVIVSFVTEPLLHAGIATGPHSDVALVTFNRFGDVLTSFAPEGQLDAYLPQDLHFGSFVDQPDTFFTATTPSGETRLISIVPILPGEVYALGSWGRAALQQTSAPWFAVSTLLFPLLMWIVGIGVAVISLNRLVVRHISDLGRRMRRFATDRDIETSKEMEDAPSEIRAINKRFERMADQLLHDEADLENAVFEREVLLKEVHHRVKNNLQLISSIINMQVRQVDNPEAVDALRQFQDRVSSLASVHRALYQEPTLTQIRFDVLLSDLVDQIKTMANTSHGAVNVDLKLANVALLPDQTSPLAMVAAEALSNAFKYGGPGQDGTFSLAVSLKEIQTDGETRVCMTIENSIDRPAGGTHGTGLGSRLMLAFASQLDGALTHTEEGDRYCLSVSFAFQPFIPDERSW